MNKRVLLAVVVCLLVLFSVLLVGGFLFLGFASRGRPSFYNTSTVLQQVQTLSQLVTVKYVMEKVVIVEDPPQNPVRRLLPDDTRVILVAHGIVKAGIDLSKLRPGDIRISGKSITVKLPPPQITDAYLDDRQTQVIERNTSFLRDFNKDLEQTARQNAVEDIRRAARNSGILSDADERGREQVKSVLKVMGFETVTVEGSK